MPLFPPTGPLILDILLWIRGAWNIGHLIFNDVVHSRQCNSLLSKRSIYHQWCALPARRALVTHSPYTFPIYMLLDLPRDIIRSVAHFRLRAHTLRIKTVTWTHNISPTCDLCNAHNVQDEQHDLFHCTHPHVVSL